MSCLTFKLIMLSASYDTALTSNERKMVWLFPQSSAIGNGSLEERLLKMYLQRKTGLMSPSFLFAHGVSGFGLPHAPTVMRHLHLKVKSMEYINLELEPHNHSNSFSNKLIVSGTLLQ